MMDGVALNCVYMAKTDPAPNKEDDRIFYENLEFYRR